MPKPPMLGPPAGQQLIPTPVTAQGRESTACAEQGEVLDGSVDLPCLC